MSHANHTNHVNLLEGRSTEDVAAYQSIGARTTILPLQPPTSKPHIALAKVTSARPGVCYKIAVLQCLDSARPLGPVSIAKNPIVCMADAADDRRCDPHQYSCGMVRSHTVAC